MREHKSSAPMAQSVPFEEHRLFFYSQKFLRFRKFVRLASIVRFANLALFIGVLLISGAIQSPPAIPIESKSIQYNNQSSRSKLASALTIIGKVIYQHFIKPLLGEYAKLMGRVLALVTGFYIILQITVFNPELKAVMQDLLIIAKDLK